MTYRMPPTLEETYACYLALIRIGYLSSEISVAYGRLVPSTTDETYMVLKAQGKTIYLSTRTYENCTKLWQKHEQFLRHEAPEKFVDMKWSRSKYGKDPDALVSLMQKLKKAGFILPELQVRPGEVSLKSVDASEFAMR